MTRNEGVDGEGAGGPPAHAFDEHRGIRLGAPALVVLPLREERGKIVLRAPEARLAEACGLARAIALEVVHSEIVRLRSASASHLFGKGQIERLAAAAAAHDAELVVIDGVVSPIQQRNLEKDLKAKVIDRTGLILEIFGERASTREGTLQVELAHLQYQASRLVRSWTHLERQRGGFGFMGGPGESQIEMDRRLIKDRIVRLKDELEDVRRTRGLHRRQRQKAPWPVVALVGYTNAGKSTLFNRMTGADVTAEDLLFATLDPTMRSIRLPGYDKVVLSDTVGFVSDLPTQLVAAFRATLEEVTEADLIVHVRDISHPDSEAQAADVAKVLADLGMDTDRPMLTVLNKIDALEPEEAEAVTARIGDDAVAVSALTGQGVDQLREQIAVLLRAGSRVQVIRLSHGDGRRLAWLHEHGEVVGRTDDDEVTTLKVRLSDADHARFVSMA
ncbi:GTPase HflX [Polymorphobacter multimanifer]|uniref:GTPase HflX n=1 Tax=Polymorphobacter multimanifer TaxID=1070431 RepID=A0A841L0V3_9SPHN|nr:GTP-binding protein HflX [Polymorphobacter multimanifer]GGI79483.1 GTPase HflX [Polymorphobacter multimanifer]